MVNSLNLLTVFTESFMLDVLWGRQSTSEKYQWSFCKIVDCFLSVVAKTLTIFEKSSVLDVLMGSEFASVCF